MAEDLRQQAKALKSEFARRLEENGVHLKDLSSFIAREFDMKGFSEATFSRNMNVVINDSLFISKAKRLKSFFQEASVFLSKYVEGDHYDVESSGFSFNNLANTTWEFYYFKHSVSQNKPGIFCGLLKFGSSENSVSIKTQRNLFTGTVILKYPGVIKLELSINRRRPLVIMGNIGGITDRPSLILVNYSNMTKDLRLVGGAGIIRFSPNASEDIVRNVRSANKNASKEDLQFHKAVVDFFHTFKNKYFKLGFAETLPELQELNNRMENRGMF